MKDIFEVVDDLIDQHDTRGLLLREVQGYMLWLSKERFMPRFESQNLRELVDKVTLELEKKL